MNVGSPALPSKIGVALCGICGRGVPSAEAHTHCDKRMLETPQEKMDNRSCSARLFIESFLDGSMGRAELEAMAPEALKALDKLDVVIKQCEGR